MAEISKEYSRSLADNGVEALIIQLPRTGQGVSLELNPADIQLFDSDPKAFIDKFIVPSLRRLLSERKELLAPAIQ